MATGQLWSGVGKVCEDATKIDAEVKKGESESEKNGRFSTCGELDAD